MQGAGSELHRQVLVLFFHLPCHQLSPQESPDYGIMPYQVSPGTLPQLTGLSIFRYWPVWDA